MRPVSARGAFLIRERRRVGVGPPSNLVSNSSWSKSSLTCARLLLLHLIFTSRRGGKVAPHPRRQRFGVNDVEHFHVVLPEVATTSKTTLRFRVARPIE